MEAAKKALPGETSAEQAQRVKELWVSPSIYCYNGYLLSSRQNVEKERRLKSKKMHSDKKSSRRGGRGDD